MGVMETNVMPPIPEDNRERFIFYLLCDEESLAYLVESDLNELITEIQEGKKTPAKTGIVRRIINWYRREREIFQEGVGTLISNLLADMGGFDGICIKLEYCKRMADLRDLLGIKEGFGELYTISGAGTARYVEHYFEGLQKDYDINPDDAQDLFEEFVGIAGDVAEFLGDNILPLSFLIYCFKYALQDLCKCCPECKGNGRTIENEACDKCGGDGYSVR